ncbi:MAG: hypothetical protein WBO17_10420 [Sphingorhabdus sp.]
MRILRDRPALGVNSPAGCSSALLVQGQRHGNVDLIFELDVRYRHFTRCCHALRSGIARSRPYLAQ